LGALELAALELVLVALELALTTAPRTATLASSPNERTMDDSPRAPRLNTDANIPPRVHASDSDSVSDFRVRRLARSFVHLVRSFDASATTDRTRTSLSDASLSRDVSTRTRDVPRCAASIRSIHRISRVIHRFVPAVGRRLARAPTDIPSSLST